MEAERRTESDGKRRPVDVLLLVLNVTIVIVGVTVVWQKWRERSGLGDRETPVLETAASGADTGGGGTETRTGQPQTGPSQAGRPQLGPDPSAGSEADTDQGSGTGPVVAAPDARHVPPDVVPAAPESAADPPRVGADTSGGDPADPQPGSARADHPRVRGHVDDRVTPPRTLPHASGGATAEDALLALAATEAAIDSVGVDLEVLRTIRGAYPSSVAAYGTNRGVEALHVALAKVGKVGDLRLGDTDDDGRMEILDAWGRPLVYFSPDDYDTTQRWAPGDAEAAELPACRVRVSEGFEAIGSYQLWSVGPDARPDAGRGDDVTSWVRRD